MNTEDKKVISHQQDLFLDDDGFADILDESGGSNIPKYENAERILHLIRLLSMSACTRADILRRLGDYYSIDEESDDPYKVAPC